MLEKVEGGVILDLRVKPNSDSFRVEVWGDELTIFCESPPEKGRANQDVVKRLSEIFSARVRLVGGVRSRRKRVFVAGVAPEYVRSVIDRLR